MNQVIVVGGGLIGMMTAYKLAEAGCSVRLLEKSSLGQEASWAGGGIISPLYPWRYPEEVSLLSQYSQQHYQAFCQGLYQLTNIDPQWIHSGMLVVDAHDEWSQARQWAVNVDMSHQQLSSFAEVNRLEPRLNPLIDQAFWLPDIAQLRNPRMVKALVAALSGHDKVTVCQHTNVTGIDIHNDKVRGVKVEGQTFSADQVVICQGAWSAELLPFSRLSGKVVPVQGQMLLFKAQTNALKRIVLSQQGYLIPRRDGRIVCGSTLEFVGFDKQVTNQAREQLQAVAYELAPFLRDCPIEHQWAGLRPGSPNGIPYIGLHPDIEGLSINAGHYRNGVVTGLASVQLLVDHLLQQDSFMDIQRFELALERPPSREFK